MKKAEEIGRGGEEILKREILMKASVLILVL